MAATGAVMAQTTATGLADTVNTDPPPGPAARSRAIPFALALAILVGGGVTWTFVRASRTPGPTAGIVNVAPEPEHAVTSPPSSLIAPVEAPVAAAPDSGISRNVLVGRSPSPSARTLAVASSSSAATAPVTAPVVQPAPSLPKTRVDQSGLAGENPFR
jgi:hypothetical protein